MVHKVLKPWIHSRAVTTKSFGELRKNQSVLARLGFPAHLNSKNTPDITRSSLEPDTVYKGGHSHCDTTHWFWILHLNCKHRCFCCSQEMMPLKMLQKAPTAQTHRRSQEVEMDHIRSQLPVFSTSDTLYL